ncbi:MAG: NACHT domain-containing protein [Elainellaceae cyanobacterium]
MSQKPSSSSHSSFDSSQPIQSQQIQAQPIQAQQIHNHNQKTLGIDHASISDAQVGGIAEGDIIQNKGSGSVFKNAIVNVFDNESANIVGQLTRQDFRNRKALLSKVQNYWIKGVLEHSLQARSPISLQLDLQPDAVMAPWREVDEALDAHPETLPPETHLIHVFDDLGDGRSLLILGSPGAGKTTALLRLAQTLVQRAEQDATYRIPVVVNLSSWSSRKRTLAQWLEDELNSKYQVPRTVGQSWIQNQNLLLLLDGLDEVQEDQRELCLDAINLFYQDYGAELVVCSRDRQYRELSQQLNFEAAVKLRSLTSEQIFDSIDPTSANLSGLRTLLQDDLALREMAASPLMLNIIVMSYQSIDDQQMLDTGLLEQKRHRIFEAYIDRMIQRRDEAPYSRAQTIRWLSWLAQQMASKSQSIFLIEGLHPDWIQHPGRRLLYNIGIKLVFMALFGGVHLGFIRGLLPDVNTFEVAQAIQGALWGILGGVLYGFIGGPLSRFITEETKFRDGSVANGALLGSIFGAMFGLSMLGTGAALTYGLAYGAVYFVLGIYTYGLLHELRGFTPIDKIRWAFRKSLMYLPFGVLIAIAIKLGTSLGLIDSVAVGLLFQVIIGFESARTVDQNAFPNYKVWRSAINALKLFAIVAPLAGIAFYLVHNHSLASGLSNGLIFGMGAALAGAGGAGLNGIKHVLLRLIFWRSQAMPWNYARFLDYGCDRILLQRVGGSYVFIHRSLLEHFARKAKSAEFKSAEFESAELERA